VVLQPGPNRDIPRLSLFAARVGFSRVNESFSAVEDDKKALADGLTPSAQELLARQFVEIKAAHDRIKSLRDASKG